MDKNKIRYQRVIDILPDIAECANGKLILVGGTALSIFYLKHRISVDLDFVPWKGDDVALERELKGCLPRASYRTIAGVFTNQFVIQFEDTSIKVEVFDPEKNVKNFNEFVFVGAKIKVASLADIYDMKILAYGKRREARDLFDLYCIMRNSKKANALIKNLLSKDGMPMHMDELRDMVFELHDFEKFEEVISNVSAKTSS